MPGLVLVGFVLVFVFAPGFVFGLDFALGLIFVLGLGGGFIPGFAFGFGFVLGLGGGFAPGFVFGFLVPVLETGFDFLVLFLSIFFCCVSIHLLPPFFSVFLFHLEEQNYELCYLRLNFLIYFHYLDRL